ADAAADQVERFAHYIESRDLNQLFSEVKGLAQRQPEIFVAGALAAGFLVGRFFKATSSPMSEEYGYSGEYRGYGPQGTVYSSGYGYGEARGYGRYETSQGYGYREDEEYGDYGRRYPESTQYGQGYDGGQRSAYGATSSFDQGAAFSERSSASQSGINSGRSIDES